MAKAKSIEVTGRQLYELKWFCQNVVGVRQDMYSTIDKVNNFDARIKRLEETATNIERWLEKVEVPQDLLDLDKVTTSPEDTTPEPAPL